MIDFPLIYRSGDRILRIPVVTRVPMGVLFMGLIVFHQACLRYSLVTSHGNTLLQGEIILPYNMAIYHWN